MNLRLPPSVAVSQPGLLLTRLRASAVFWSWVANGLRLASGLILLPLLLNKLSAPDLGMYYVLLSLVALVPLVDFGFNPTLGRFVSYAMGGATSIQPQGVAQYGGSSGPNYELLWQLLFTTRTLYRYLTVVLLIVLGCWGTYVVELRIDETTWPFLTRVAWITTLVSALFDIYANWWVNYLSSMNQVSQSARIGVVGVLVRLTLASVLLLFNGGLLSLPIGTLVGSTLVRYLSRRRCLEMLGGHPPPAAVDVRKHLRVFWPNTWRLGLQVLSGYLTVNANTAICLHVLGLDANAQYGLSVQLVFFLAGIASVWTSVKWPLIGQFRAQHDLSAVRRVLWPRVWLQNVTFVLGAAVLLIGAPLLLKLFGGGKQMLPFTWLSLLILNSFLEMQFNIWGTLLSTQNRLPYLWPAVATNVLSLVFSLVFIHFTSLGLGGLVLGPLLAGCLFNYWFWPLYAARNIGTSLLRFLVTGPETHRTPHPLAPVQVR